MPKGVKHSVGRAGARGLEELVRVRNSTSNSPRAPLPVMEHRCPTCPFNPEGKGYTEVRGLLTSRALSSGTPICHSTGDSDITESHEKIHNADHACRGARDLQLFALWRKGFLAQPTDEAWTAKCKELGI